MSNFFRGGYIWQPKGLLGFRIQALNLSVFLSEYPEDLPEAYTPENV